MMLEFISILTITNICINRNRMSSSAERTFHSIDSSLQRPNVASICVPCPVTVSLLLRECIQIRRQTSNDGHLVTDATDKPFLKLQLHVHSFLGA